MIALAMLLMAALYAAQPVDRPLSPVSGSAFSAATFEVAIAPARQAVAEQAAVAPQPLIPLGVIATLPVLHIASAAHILPDSTAPPPYPLLARGPAPRAPPTA